MKARQRARRRARSPWIIAGTVAGFLPTLHAAPVAHQPAATSAVERRLILDRDRLEGALAHIRIWTPSETLPRLPWQDAAEGIQPRAPQDAPVFRFAIPAGSLAAAVAEFAKVTGLTVQVPESLVATLTTDGVAGVYTAAQALERLLAGASLTHRFTDASTILIEIRVAADRVEVSGALPQIRSAKYSTPIVETPQTIQVIPRALIDEQGATTLSEALRNVPGITMQAGEGGGASNTSGDMFNMRGFSASNSLFVDGVRDDGLIARDVFNLEQIEVFSGPTGSDVGRANASGYVNLTTKAPHLQSARSAALGYADSGQLRVTVDVNEALALGERGSFFGNSAVRLNALWQDGGVAGRDHSDRESKSIAPSIALGLGTPTRVSVSGQIMRQDNLPDYGLPAAASPVGTFTAAGILAVDPVDQSTYYGSPDYDYDRISQDSATVRVEHDVRPGMLLRNQTRYNRTRRDAVITSIQNAAAYDPATDLVTLSRQANERHNDIFSNQTSLIARVATGRLRHDLSLGLELTRESQFAPTLTGVGTRAPVNLHAPDVFSPVVGMNIVPTGALAEGSTDTAAVYAFDAFDLGARVRVSGGIRVEAYDTESHSVTAAGIATDLRGRDTLVSGKAGILYRLNARGNVYASYGSSLTPPGSANFQLNAAASNQNNPNVDPQESTNYEIGTKWDLAGSRLLLTGSYFWTRNKNVIFVVDPTTVPPTFNQDDGQRVEGVSLGVLGRIGPRLDLNMSVQYLDSRSESQNPALDGRRLTLTPELSGSLWATARLARDIRVGGGLVYTDRVFVNAANTIVVPRYAVADALVEAPIGRRLTLRLNVYNLTDREYVRNVNNNAGRYNPGTPRSFLVTSAVRF